MHMHIATYCLIQSFSDKESILESRNLCMENDYISMKKSRVVHCMKLLLEAVSLCNSSMISPP